MQTQIGPEKPSRRERRERRLQEKIEAKRLARENLLVAELTDPPVATAVESEMETIADNVPPPPMSETRLIQPLTLAFVVAATTLDRHRAKPVVASEPPTSTEPETRVIDQTRIWEIDGMRLLDRQLHALLRSKTITFAEFWAMAPCVSIDQFVTWVRNRAPVVEHRLNTLGGTPLWIRKSGQPTEEGRLIWAAFRERVRRMDALECIFSGAIKASPEVESLLGAA